ncbi:MAG TPA: DUF308 domain-containing protein [Alloacidobacterium sp.]|nr:DUF308 domain-containing protein [Alloacidobacterium sp.]
MATGMHSMLKRGTGLAIAWAVILILCGIFSLALPLIAGISTAIVISILIITAGIVHLTTGPISGSFGGYLWRTLVGIVYIIGGVWLFMHPVLGLVSFTFVLGIIFVIEGILAIISFFLARKTTGSGWLLFDGIVTLLLAFLILYHWPSSAAWAIATIVGINLLISGITRLMALVALRRFLNEAA